MVPEPSWTAESVFEAVIEGIFDIKEMLILLMPRLTLSAISSSGLAERREAPMEY
jgi:hypothetical protein